MIDVAKAASSLERLSILKLFPMDDAARTEIVSIACEMAETNDQIDWLATCCRNVWNQWEGPREFRALYCSRFRPRDGIEAYSQLERFIDGYPPEKPEAALAVITADERAGKKRLTAADCCADEEIQKTIIDLAKAKNFTANFPPIIRPIPVRREEGRITQADIDRAVAEHRANLARKELEEAS